MSKASKAPEQRYPPHPAHLDPYVEVLGAELALRFFIQFGGSPSLYFPKDPKGKSGAEKLIGARCLKALGERLSGPRVNIPRPRTWMIHALAHEGRSQSEICRLAGCSHETVRRALKLSPSGASHPAELSRRTKPDDGQIDLF